MFVIAQKGRVWTMQLLAIACLSLAAKLEETDVPMILDLQVGTRNLQFFSAVSLLNQSIHSCCMC